MAFRTLVMLCLAAVAGGIMTRGASEGSLPSKRSVAGRRAAKGSGSGGFWGVVADAVEGLADALEGADEADEADEMEMHKTSSDEADEADETEMHKTSLDADDEEDEVDMTSAELRALSAFQDFYGEERLEEIADIMDRGTAPDASENDKERAKEYTDKAAELAEAAGALDAAASADGAAETEMHKTSLDVGKDDEGDEEDEEDLTPAELRAASALRDFYGGEEGLEEATTIVERGTAPDASEDDQDRANEYLDKMSEVVDATSAGEGGETEMHQTSLDEARADREADREAREVSEQVAHGLGEIADAVAPLATELLDAVLGDDEEDEA